MTHATDTNRLLLSNKRPSSALPPAPVLPDMRQSSPTVRWTSPLPSSRPSVRPTQAHSLTHARTHSLAPALRLCLSGWLAHRPFFSQSVSQSVGLSLSLSSSAAAPLVHRVPVRTVAVSSSSPPNYPRKCQVHTYDSLFIFQKSASLVFWTGSSSRVSFSDDLTKNNVTDLQS